MTHQYYIFIHSVLRNIYDFLQSSNFYFIDHWIEIKFLIKTYLTILRTIP